MVKQDDKKGASTLLVVFIIMVVALLGVTWFRATGTSGTGLQDDIVRQSEINSFEHKFQNAKLYMENSLYHAGQKGSNRATNFSGRRAKSQEARYWYCRDSKQIPKNETVRYTSSNFTLRYMQNRTEELHGIRDNTVYEIGKASCVETGYERLPASKDGDQFRQAVKIDSIKLSQEGSSLSKEEENIQLSKEIKHNRKWYMYSILKDWIKNENLKDEVSSELSKVKDVSSDVNNMCITDGSKCNYPDPKMCSDHGSEFDSAVALGLQNEADKLANNPQYFNGSDIECSFSPNQKNGYDFPGHQVTVGVSQTPDNQSSQCGCANTNSTGHCIEPKWQYKCTTQWGLTVDSKIDTTLTCRDEFFSNVPMNDTAENLNWNIDLSFSVNDGPSGPSYSCSEPPRSYAPSSLKSCSYSSSSSSTCSTGVDVIG